MQQPVPSQCFQYKTIGKMQFKMQKNGIIKKTTLFIFSSGLDFSRIALFIHVRSSGEFFKILFYFESRRSGLPSKDIKVLLSN